jgi:hypothetical protein
VWTNETVRESVVKLLQDHTQTELAALCPLSQVSLIITIDNKIDYWFQRQEFLLNKNIPPSAFEVRCN